MPSAVVSVLQGGNTPAHLAARRGHPETIKLLFIRGADCRVSPATFAMPTPLCRFCFMNTQAQLPAWPMTAPSPVLYNRQDSRLTSFGQLH